MDAKPIRFIARRIAVEFAEPPVFEKTPPCPTRFVWNGDPFDVIAVLTEWDDFSGKTMHSHQAGVAQQHGTWGMGRVYFRVETDSGRIFDLVYDPSQGAANDFQDSWILFREMKLIATDGGGDEPSGEDRG